MRTTRRSTVTASGAVVLGLAGCTSATPGSSTGQTPSTSGQVPDPTGTAEPDPDRSALDRAVAISTGLLADIGASDPGIDPTRKLTELHEAHLSALRSAGGDVVPTATASPGPLRRLDRARLRKRELAAQRQLAGLALAAESGALARLLASMSAGIAAGLSHRGEVPR